MKMCKDHWQMCRDAIDERGMGGLVMQSGEAATENLMKELQGEKPDFDPLMSMNNHWWSGALKNGGLYLMSVNEQANPNNEGHYCPLCEYVKHASTFDAKRDIGIVADQMAEHCHEHGLIARPS